MNRKGIILITVAVLLAITYIQFFSDWFSSPRIQIIPQVRPIRALQTIPSVLPVSFILRGSYKLTRVKVVELGVFQTNKYVAPVWHLISKTNSPPIQGLTYGLPIPGMVLANSNAPPQELLPHITYRLFVEAGRAKGDVDFQTREADQTQN